MNRRISQFPYLLILAGLSAFVAPASAGTVSPLSGSYQVIGKTDVGSQTQVRIQIRLANTGERDLKIQRLTLWNSPHPPNRSDRKCSLLIHPGASAETTPEFTIPRSQYRQWERGTNPRLLLEVASPGGRKTTELLRLVRTSGGKVN